MAQEKINFFKKNIFVVPVVASLVVGTFTSVKYVVNLTDTIRSNAEHIEKIQTALKLNKLILKLILLDLKPL